MKIKTLTPVHIGSGSKLTRMDFIVRNGKVIVLNTPELFRALEGKGCDMIKIVDELSYRSLDDLAKDFDIDAMNFKLYEARLVGSAASEISEQIKSGRKPYIPGSSIKGAIRTAILWYIVKNDRFLLNFAIKCLEDLARGRITSKVLKETDDRLEKKVFGKDPRKDFMRALKVTDSTSFSELTVYEIKILGSNIKGVCVECIDENDSASIKIEIDERVLADAEIASKLKEYELDGIEKIAEMTREFSLTLIEKELTYNHYDDETKSIFKNIKSSKGMLLRVGWGTGWYSKTIGLLLETHPKFENLRKKIGLGRSPRTKRVYDEFPKTRRVTIDGKPLGWICIV